VSGGPLSPQPPSTNRGVVRPTDDRLGGGIDYLKLTVWAPPKEVMGILTNGALDRYGWKPDPLDTRQEWTEQAAGGRAREIMSAGSLQVIAYLDDVQSQGGFCSVEVKGQGCAHFGNEGVRLILDDLGAVFRVRASRVDLMAHTELFTPRDVREVVEAGNYNSRSVDSEKLVWMSSAAGDTCYLGMTPKPSGGMKRVGDRVLRAYNLRGPTRVELEMHGEYAHGAGDALREIPVEQWPEFTRGCLRHYCDFVDRAVDPRAARSPLLPWWDAFVNGAEKISVRPPDELDENSPLGKLDGILQRHMRRLNAGIDAYGADWLIGRIKHHGRQECNESYGELVHELLPYRGTGIAGVPEQPDAAPF